MKKLSDFKHGDVITFRTRWGSDWTGKVNHYIQPKGRIFYSVHCDIGTYTYQFIQTEIAEIYEDDRRNNTTERTDD